METNKLGQWARKRLAEVAKEADSRLGKYWIEEIRSNFGFNDTQKDLIKKMLLHAKEHNLRSAKRARAGFVIYGYQLGQEPKESRNQELETETEKVWRAAEAVELVHTALLMHDDFMDRDLVRRGGPTTQIFFGDGDDHHGESMAVCLGDAVLCLGFERLLDCGFDEITTSRVMKQFLRGITNTAFGQAYDASLSKLGEMTEEKVMSLHRAKTAIYTFENPLIIGGSLSGLSPEVLNVLREYAVDGGIAFQLQDDVLGVYGDEEKTGKSANSDLLQGKVTLLVVKAMEMGTEDQKNSLREVWGKLRANKKAIDGAKKAILESGAYEYSIEVAKNYAEKAAETATKLRGRGLNSGAIDYLEGIARYMVEREM
ncbi:TPA: hypothetical protein DIU27_04930 [Candidatus Collierbacteria bacterium]|uniref:Polyprenyl synthetase superfamily n=1 Tax=Candidatus Collierbacteria bacterium GW2011_GWB2_44_22 TaxID=1618387 RepID=A0A0G1KTT1_9BACT|nr:MAG: hypothetical protein UW31_C0006G0028 [Candidatus Collierbacteria bacterium GW2011_GWA2_44_13]KKT51309.1 MAG: hypothetical protein UW44_C0013G0029 [Candidatus Collierbacteria bacterium GW2011_GWB2_44_22]KKT66567.1 MAG: hypothetical protein UW58_C0006G0030 [Candidatus Collierbacteria bacterium GW2011_GWC2_44_30]KKT68885.1 MAG: hypothetical protein UW64_C0008G0029 [Microgenomates group bacterium GW2011_GWC1_44_37]KKT88447.1 MAG: hypothetical protein UW88_C0011G0087 [Candidatus Collierbacte